MKMRKNKEKDKEKDCGCSDEKRETFFQKRARLHKEKLLNHPCKDCN